MRAAPASGITGETARGFQLPGHRGSLWARETSALSAPRRLMIVAPDYARTRSGVTPAMTMSRFAGPT
jgi:hypothetical protein